MRDRAQMSCATYLCALAGVVTKRFDQLLFRQLQNLLLIVMHGVDHFAVRNATNWLAWAKLPKEEAILRVPSY